MNMWWWVLLVYAALVFVLVMSLLRTAGDADARAEREYERFMERGAAHQPDESAG